MITKNTFPTGPETLQEAMVFFSNPDNALGYMMPLVWPKGIVCPHCGVIPTAPAQHHFIASRRIWRCTDCKKQFSIKMGTVMEDSPLGLDKWLSAMWLIANAKNGISSYEIHRALGVTQKSAWFLLHRIRLAMKTGSFKKMTGTVEADECFVGGVTKNMHKAKREKKMKGPGVHGGKAIVAGLLERGAECSQVKATIVRGTKRPHVQRFIRKNVEPGSEVMTDALRSYRSLSDTFIHQWIDHEVAYVRDTCHTNGLENFWSLLRRTLDGTYVACEPFHLQRYLDEQCFRFNFRKLTDGERFSKVLAGVAGKRLTLAELTGKTGVNPVS